MSGFAFLPRSVKKRKIEPSPKQDQVSASVASISTPAGPPIEIEGQSSAKARVELLSKGKERAQNALPYTTEEHPNHAKKGPDLEDLARVVWLALSDYALWSDADLRRKIDWASQDERDNEGEGSDDDVGYIPLSYLMKNSPAFLHASSTPSLAGQPEITYVKAIRAHASDLVDVRLILSNEDPSGFGANRWPTKKSATGYEVRRKNAQNRFREYGKADWHDLTIYIENIPISYRNICGVSKLVSCLSKSLESPISKVQHVSFPPRHNDRPGTLPSCRGFALVTLSVAEDVEFILDKWPWDEDGVKGKNLDLEEPDVFRREALKFGFCCMSKTRWEELRAEYLLHRQQLVAELEEDNAAQEKLNRSEASVHQEAHHNPTMESHDQRHDEPPVPVPQITITTQSKRETSAFNFNAPFPPECLVFVRNVQPETNKTTLRALFLQASKDGLDYVDYTKGLDSCHLRFSSPSHAMSFVNFFTSNPVTQTSALDGEGKKLNETSNTGSTALAVTPELVTGKREELYWQKVPEKIRRQAVEKALSQGSDGTEAQGKKRRRGK